MKLNQAISAILLGFTGVALVCGLTYFSDAYMRQTYMVGNFMPISVYGGLVFFLLVVNTLLFAIGKRLAFTGPQLALAIAMTLAACVVPASGLMRTFPESIIMPYHWAKTVPGWKENKVIEMAPKQMLVDVTPENENATLTEYISGQGRNTNKPVPWAAWSRPLMFWIPLMLTCWMALMGLALVVHRQWAHHEHLPYPVAAFTNALLPGEGSAIGAVFRSRLFQIAFLAVFAIHLNNYIVAIAPNVWVALPLSFPIRELLVAVGFSNPPWWLQNVHIYFTVIAFAYFLATDVSLSVGLGPIIYTVITASLASRGVAIAGGGGTFSANIQSFLVFGAYLGMAGVLMYTGRAFYASVCRRAVFMKARDEVAATAIWGARLFVIGGIGAVVLMRLVGLDWQLGILYFLGYALTFVIMSRIVAETGLFFVQVYWFPCGVIAGLFGAQALGPQAMLIMFMLSMVLLVDPREAFMPFIVNAFKIADQRQVKLATTARWSAAALVFGLCLAVVVTLTVQYRRGVPMADAWASRIVPQAPFVEVVNYKQRLEAQGTLEKSETVKGFARLGVARPQKAAFIWALLIGAGLVILFTVARLRFNKWPLHPVMFLVWAAMPAGAFAWSFLFGWLTKSLVTKYGGAKVYQQLKPLMFGLIAGEMVGGLTPIMCGYGYYFYNLLIHGVEKMPTSFGIMPG